MNQRDGYGPHYTRDELLVQQLPTNRAARRALWSVMRKIWRKAKKVTQ